MYVFVLLICLCRFNSHIQPQTLRRLRKTFSFSTITVTLQFNLSLCLILHPFTPPNLLISRLLPNMLSAWTCPPQPEKWSTLQCVVTVLCVLVDWCLRLYKQMLNSYSDKKPLVLTKYCINSCSQIILD